MATKDVPIAEVQSRLYGVTALIAGRLHATARQLRGGAAIQPESVAELLGELADDVTADVDAIRRELIVGKPAVKAGD